MIARTKIVLSSLTLGILAAASPVMANPAPVAAQAGFAPGAKVSDTQGGEVGTITSVDGDFVILKTDRHEVRLPKTSFTAVDDGFIMAMTRDQVNAAVDQAQAKAADSIAVGAVVRDTSGGVVGTIQELDEQFATLKLPNIVVKLPLSSIAPSPSGPVIAMTAAELEAEAGGSASAATADTGADAAVAAEASPE